MLRNILCFFAFACVCAAAILAQSAVPSAGTSTQSQTTTATATPKPAMQGFGLEDGTPVKMRTARTISSADAHAGDTLDFEVLEEIKVNGLLLIPKGGIAWGTVTEAEPKRRMARGGKLNVNIDSVRLADGEKAALRAVKEAKGGGHTGAMTGGMVATAIVFFPAAPFFLFMHGKDITIPKGTEITAYINGDTPLEQAKFETSRTRISTSEAGVAANTAATAELQVSSTPVGADIEIDGKFVGSTPSSISLPPGDHEIAVKKSGFAPWNRKITVSAGHINVSADLTPEPK